MCSVVVTSVTSETQEFKIKVNPSMSEVSRSTLTKQRSTQTEKIREK